MTTTDETASSLALRLFGRRELDLLGGFANGSHEQRDQRCSEPPNSSHTQPASQSQTSHHPLQGRRQHGQQPEAVPVQHCCPAGLWPAG